MITITVKVQSKDYDNVYEDLVVKAHLTKVPGLAIARPFMGWMGNEPMFGEHYWRIFHTASGWFIHQEASLQGARKAVDAFGKIIDWTKSLEEIKAIYMQHQEAIRKIRNGDYT